MNTVFITHMTGDFETFWRLGPWERLGRKAAERHFKASVKTERDWKDIQFAREIYIDHLRRNPWKRPQHGSTWFNNWRDWLDMVATPNLRTCKACSKACDATADLCDACFRTEYIRIRDENLRKRGVVR